MNISNKPVSTVSKNGTNNTWKYVLLALFIIAIMHNFFGALSYDFFVIIDNVLGTSGASSPVFIWTLFGALIGIMLGGMVALVGVWMVMR
ncbi:MAG: hypothetical protein EOO88_62855 [Pedobacter sp.]|nr:MAG: hypothetical protein EOO88_62855 [Pedobacter sp.]